MRWVGIFLFFAAAPQYIFRLGAKVLRPVVEAADTVVSSVEEMAAK